MKTEETADGSTIHYVGSLKNQNILIIIGRNDFHKDYHLIHSLIQSLQSKNCTIVWYEHRGITTARLMQKENSLISASLKKKPFTPYVNNILNKWPKTQNFKGKVMSLMTYISAICKNPNKWKSLLSAKNENSDNIPFRTKSLRQFIKSLSAVEGAREDTKRGTEIAIERNIFILARSAGSRVATLIADEPGLEKIICLGYPFKHPEKSNEPDRYEHLATIHKPTLIIQGDKDEYGGKEISSLYSFSSHVTLQFIDTDHSFEISNEAWQATIKTIQGFLRI